MKRSEFIKRSFLTGLALSTGNNLFGKPTDTTKSFALNYAPHQGMFENHAGPDFLDQIKFMHEKGFRSIEDNGMMERSEKEQKQIGNLLTQLEMQMGVFVINGGDNWKPSLTTGKKEFLDTFLKTCHESVEVAKRCNAKWLTVVPGFFERNIPMGLQTSNVIEALKRGTEILEAHGLIMVLEALSDTPDLFLRYSDQAYMICKAVDSPSCKILYDIYHMQRNEGNLMDNIDRCWDEIAYFQIGDNPGRNEPNTGEIHYKNLFKHIYDKGYRGIMGMEHGLSMKGKEGELKLIEAYRATDVV